MLDEIGQIAITVSDVDRSLKFYREVLGLQFLFSAGPNLAFLSAGSVRIMLTKPEVRNHPRVTRCCTSRLINWMKPTAPYYRAELPRSIVRTKSRICLTTNCGWHSSVIPIIIWWD